MNSRRTTPHGRGNSFFTRRPKLERLEAREMLTVADSGTPDLLPEFTHDSSPADVLGDQFHIYEAVYQRGAPDLVQDFGWEPIQLLFTGVLWNGGDDMSEPNLARVREVAQTLDDNQLVVLDIEHWPTRGSQADESIRKLASVADAVKDVNPDLVIGYYAQLPVQDYWSVVLHEHDPDQHGERYDGWVDANSNLAKLAEHVDVIFPSIYVVMPDYERDGTPRIEERQRWVSYATENIEQARQYGKPVIPFIAPIYSAGSAPSYFNRQPIGEEFWQLILDTTAELGDGAVLYATGTVGDWNPDASWWHQTQDLIDRLQGPSAAPPQVEESVVIDALTTDASANQMAAVGEPVTITAQLTLDAVAADALAAEVAWGDGTASEQVVVVAGDTPGLATVQVQHVFQQGGMPNITLTIFGSQGQPLAEETTSAVVTGVGLNDGVLQIVGKNTRDLIFIEETVWGPQKVQITSSSFSQRPKFTAADIERIEIYTWDGADKVFVSHPIAVPMLISGGAGADELHAGQGPTTLLGGDGADLLYGGEADDVLEGGAGKDTLEGGSGNDLLIGGAGKDRLIGDNGADLLVGGRDADWLAGGRDDDLLIAGTTVYDDDHGALLAFLSEWTSERAYEARITNLRTSAGAVLSDTGISLQEDVTVQDDAFDVMQGAHGNDWFFMTRGRIEDRQSAELRN